MCRYLVLAVSIACALACDYREDLSPFFWKNQQNVCTEQLCKVYDYLKCNVSREYIMDQAIAHMENDILWEIEIMQEYFNTLIPTPVNTLPYACDGVCQQGVRTLQLQRIFTTVNVRTGAYPAYESRHMMCIIIGPDLYYQQCGGKCNILNNVDRYCVPDITVRVQLWVFCPDVEPGCHKVDFDLPLSCTCKKITCNKVTFPEAGQLLPNIPVAPVGWVPGQGIGQSLGVANPGLPLTHIKK